MTTRRTKPSKPALATKITKAADTGQTAPSAIQAAASTELAALAAQIAHHDRAYHQRDAPEITDAAYDALRYRLAALEAAHPDWVAPNSPLRQVGAPPAGGFAKVAHRVPMLSLGNGFSAEQMIEWEARIRRFLALPLDRPLPLVAEPKIDGMSISLTYADGVLVGATTRGDGTTGEDVTANARVIPAIPQQLRGSGWPDLIEIRGEIYMTKADFLALNERLAANGERLLANPRNAAAGSTRQLDVAVTASRTLSLFVYAVGHADRQPAATHAAYLARLQEWGFAVNPLNERVDGQAAMAAFHASLAERRATLAYDVDGTVFKVDDLVLQQRLGFAGREPRWAIAWKFPPEQATTRLEEIGIQVGRTGALTPVAHLTPVTVGGVLVTRATLHNEDEIARHDVRPGDRVLLQRAGDVIPQIIGPVLTPGAARSAPFAFPTLCPACGSPAQRDNGDVVRRCTGGLVCPAQRTERLLHAIRRPALDIDGLGERTIVDFEARGWLPDLAALFHLPAREAEIAALDGWGTLSAARLSASIARARATTLPRLIFALGIRRVGETIAKLLARHFGTFAVWRAAMLAASEPGSEARAALDGIVGIGETITDALAAFFAEPRQVAALDALAAELVIAQTPVAASESALTGKVIVFTGSLDTLTRPEARARAEALGARVTDSVSKNTDLVVLGADAGTKAKRAAELGVATVDEAGFRQLAGLEALS